MREFLKKFNDYKSRNPALLIADTEDFIKILTTANLFVFEHLEIVLTDEEDKNQFLEGYEASKYNFGDRMFRRVLLKWVQEIVEDDKRASNTSPYTVIHNPSASANRDLFNNSPPGNIPTSTL